MNYSKNIKKRSIANRVFISWVVVGIFFLIIGIIIGSIILQNNEPKPTAQTETLVYGRMPDGKIYEGEMSITFDNADLNFVPLDVPMDEGLQEFIYYLSAGYNMDFTFVMALIQKESGFGADIISKTNDYGLMQINTVNHEWLTETLGVTDFIEPYDNVRAGMFVLRKLFEKYENPEKVLMAYNMGEHGASVLWKKGILTSKYSRKVMENMDKYKVSANP